MIETYLTDNEKSPKEERKHVTNEQIYFIFHYISFFVIYPWCGSPVNLHIDCFAGGHVIQAKYRYISDASSKNW